MRTALVAVALGLALAAPTAPASARSTPVLTVDDPKGDVHLNRLPGLSTADRRSVDLTRLAVTDRGDSVRFTVKLLRVNRSPRLTQIFLFDIASDELPYSQLVVATHSLSIPPRRDDLEHVMAIENADAPQGFVSCRRLPVSLPNGARTFWVEVPKRCLPSGQVRLRVYAQTVPGPADDPAVLRQYSHDSLRVAGRFDLGGTVHGAPT